MNTKGKRLILTNFACKQAVRKKFTAERIQDAFDNPEQIVPNDEHPGQHYIVSKGVSILGEFKEDRFIGITFKDKQ